MGAPQARMYELAVRLKAKGYRLTIVAAMPSYLTVQAFNQYRGRTVAREELDGIKLIWTALYPSRSTNLLVRRASNIFITVGSPRAGWTAGSRA
jgi:hypothetical protein